MAVHVVKFPSQIFLRNEFPLTPSGGGKALINPEYVLSRNTDRVVVRNFEGKVFEDIQGDRTPPPYKPSEDFVTLHWA